MEYKTEIITCTGIKEGNTQSSLKEKLEIPSYWGLMGGLLLKTKMVLTQGVTFMPIGKKLDKICCKTFR